MKEQKSFFENLIKNNRYVKSINDAEESNYKKIRKLDFNKTKIRNSFKDKSKIPHTKRCFAEELKQIIANNILHKDKDELVGMIDYSFQPFTQNILYSPNTSMTKKEKKQNERNLQNLFYKDETYSDTFNLNITHELGTISEILPKEDSDIKKIFGFVENIGNKRSQLNKNYTIFVEGEIGVGKTTLLTKIMHMAKDNSDDKNFVVYKIDFYNFANEIHDTDDKEIDLEFIKEKILDKFRNDSLLKNKNKILLFLDNLDIVYQRFCERYFIYKDHIKFKKILLLFIQALKEIKFGSTYFATFIALRKESIRVLKRDDLIDESINQYSVDAFNQIDLIITLEDIKPERIKSIILKRLEMIKKIVDESYLKDDIKKMVSNNILNFEKETKIDFKELANISTEGLRHTIHLFSKISLSVLDEEYFNRYMMKHYFIKKLHFLGKDLLYSQVNKGIFNIFLNNASYRIHWCKNTESFVPSELTEISEMGHMHTYWLKYFILLYLYEKTKEDEFVDVDEIIQTFSQDGSDQIYEENLVRLVLLGLSEVSHGRLIDICLSKKEEIEGFKITKRAKYVVNNIIWTFDYLSVTMEDIWLEIPKKIRKISFFSTNLNGYCLKRDNFNEDRKESFILQIKKVFLFVDLLELTYGYEFEKVKGTFDYIIEQEDIKQIDFDNGIKFGTPNFTYIRKKLKGEMQAYLDEYNYVDVDIDNIYSNLEETEIKNAIEKTSNILNKSYFLKPNDHLVVEDYFNEQKSKLKDILI